MISGKMWILLVYSYWKIFQFNISTCKAFWTPLVKYVVVLQCLQFYFYCADFYCIYSLMTYDYLSQVQHLLQQLQDKFQTTSDQVLSRNILLFIRTITNFTLCILGLNSVCIVV